MEAWGLAVNEVADQIFGTTGFSPSLRILLVLTMLALLPALVLTMTSFVRTVVVLSFVRQGVGSPQTPPNQVIIGLALFLSLFTMAPVATEVKTVSYDAYETGQLTETQALEAAVAPLRKFMLRQTREEDLRLFYDAAGAELPLSAADVPLRYAIPAFVISELTTAFQMGVMILLPFLVIDLAVASMLMSMGMMMVPPATLSLPVKLLLFVLVDGWNLIAGSVLRSFA